MFSVFSCQRITGLWTGASLSRGDQSPAADGELWNVQKMCSVVPLTYSEHDNLIIPLVLLLWFHDTGQRKHQLMWNISASLGRYKQAASFHQTEPDSSIQHSVGLHDEINWIIAIVGFCSLSEGNYLGYMAVNEWNHWLKACHTPVR